MRKHLKTKKRFRIYETICIEISFHRDHTLIKTIQKVNVFQSLVDNSAVEYTSKRLIYAQSNTSRNRK